MIIGICNCQNGVSTILNQSKLKLINIVIPFENLRARCHSKCVFALGYKE